MTDRIKGLVVLLDEDMRSDDAQELINAIKCMRYVQEVSTSVVNVDDYMNRERVRAEFRMKLWNVINAEKR